MVEGVERSEGGAQAVKNNYSLRHTMERIPPELISMMIVAADDGVMHRVLPLVSCQWRTLCLAALPLQGRSNYTDELALRGHLEVLQWARQNGCPWDELTCAYAAAGGHLEVLQWARQNGCPWDQSTCVWAASGGHLEVLQWARQNGCPWDELTCLGSKRRPPGGAPSGPARMAAPGIIGHCNGQR